MGGEKRWGEEEKEKGVHKNCKKINRKKKNK